ncbi:MAG TPA: M24 family metallopeptidase [Thermoanaerobaculia bacterium]|jgi:Xaa-Pro aminopeptidase|nr:M24 family metallopeptidase [Thermoanaerobaculia bacterium]
MAGLAAGLAEMGCQALLVVAQSGGDPDLAPFLAVPAHLGAALLVAPRGGQPRLAFLMAMERDEAAATGLPLITPADLEVLRAASEAPEPAASLAWVIGRALAASGVTPGRVALAGLAPAGEIYGACAALAARGWEWVAGNELVRQVRKRKTAAELAAIRQAAAAATAVLRAVAARLAAARPAGPPELPEAPEVNADLWLDGSPLTIGRLRAAVARLMADHGVEQPRGNILAPGDEAGVPHSAGSDGRVLRAGEPLIVDLFPRLAARDRPPLFADCTRTLCAGEPPAAVVRAHGVLLEALAVARSLAVPGARGWDLQEAVCLHLEEAGYATPLHHPDTTTGYVHNLGHGIGYELHELPVFRKVAGAEGVLAEGDVFTLEPGLYDAAGGYGVRLEDLCYLGPAGLEVLTPLPYDLDPRQWPAPTAADTEFRTRPDPES